MWRETNAHTEKNGISHTQSLFLCFNFPLVLWAFLQTALDDDMKWRRDNFKQNNNRKSERWHTRCILSGAQKKHTHTILPHDMHSFTMILIEQSLAALCENENENSSKNIHARITCVNMCLLRFIVSK